MSTIFSRRNLLLGAGVVAVGAGTTYFLTQGGDSSQGLPTPAVIASKDGVLNTELTVSAIEKKIAKSAVTMIGYNGSVPGPTLKVRPGDTVNVKLTNNLDQATNLHTHGLFVNPNENSDNPFVHVMAGESFDYRFEIPADHAEGTHWYHPHLHGQVANQVFGGLYGAIIVEDESSPIVSEDRVLVISDASFNSDGTIADPNMMELMMGREGDFVLVNGELQPKGETKQHALERWRIVNACVARYLSLQVVGGQATLLGLDGRKFEKSEEFDTRVLAPGNRADVLVSVNTDKVSLVYNTVAHPDAGMMGMSSQTYADYPLVTFNTVGVATVIAAEAKFKPSPDLRNATVNGKRQFTLAMPNHAMAMGAGTMEGMFTINGEAFNMDKVNTTVANDTVEEWTIANTSTMQHPFHLHIWPMQMISVNGSEVTGLRYQDVVTVPANGQVVVRVNFHTHTGKTLYHCHILDHEDLGMMGVIQSL
jgi:FtsP/CotA-like multicopper oxidase with cupredoxin domain